MWDAVAEKLKKNKEFEEVVGHRGGNHIFIWEGFCECGAPMTRRTVNGPGERRLRPGLQGKAERKLQRKERQGRGTAECRGCNKDRGKRRWT